MKKFILIVLFIALGALCSISLEKDNIFTGKEEIKYALGDIIVEQREMDKKIEEYKSDGKYTFYNPKIIVNPYKLTPLTALIIFHTKESTHVKVIVNDKEMTAIEKSKIHLVPIYGMYAGTDNKIKLVLDNGKSKEYTIKTENYDGDLLKVEESSEQLDDSLYFLSPNFVENCIYDKNGNLLWYIKGDYAGDIRYLDNGHFYISDPYQGTNGVKINYSGFLEMDYLGKIYKQYITPYGYHHEIVQLKDNKVLTLGAKDDSPFFEGVLYIMDLNTGKIEKTIDMYEYLHEIAPKWIESLGNNFDFVLNSAYYDEKNNDVLLSCRGIGVIMKYDFDTDKIKWMFGDPENLPGEFDKYLVTVIDDTKYPYGEHGAFITKDGNIAFHNNDADQFHMESERLVDYLDKYTTNVVVEVNEKEKTLHTVWEYDAEEREFSKVGGKLEFLSNGNTLINYGWSITRDAYEDPENITINDTNYLNGIVVELDENNNVLFKGTTKGLIYRVYKINLYGEKTNNYNIDSYKKIDGTKYNGQMIRTSKIKNKLSFAKKYDGEFNVLINRMMINMKMDKKDEIKAVFVGEKGLSHVYTYKKKNTMPRIFNTDMYGPVINIPKGKYKVYVIKNNDYLDTNIQMNFE